MKKRRLLLLPANHRTATLLRAGVLTALFAAPVCSAAQTPGDGHVRRFAAAIEAQSADAIEYLAEKLRTCDIVGLGEDHWLKDHPQFLCEALRTLARDTTVRIDVLAVEFGNQRDQALADSLVASPVYRHDLVLAILRDAPDDVGNPYKEYADIFRTVWEVNRTRPVEKRTRILLLDPPFILDALDGKPYRATGSRDDAQFTLLRTQLLRQKHVLFYCGLGHVGRRIWGQYLPAYDRYYNWPSTGHLLKATYPDRVCLLELWGARMGSDGYIARGDAQRWERLYNGVFDDAFRLNGDRAVGFDLRGPAFDTLTVARHFSAPEAYERWDARADKGNPNRKETRLADYVDGILFIGPVERFSGATVIGDLYDDAFVERVSARHGGRLSSRRAIYAYIRDNHPVMRESLDRLIAGEEPDARPQPLPAE